MPSSICDLTVTQRNVIDNVMLNFSDDPESDSLLSEIGAKSWRQGGCYALSLAVRDVFDGSSIVGLGVAGEGSDAAHHTLVSYRGYYIDSKGCHSAEEIISEYMNASGRPVALFEITESTLLPKSGDEDFQDRLFGLIAPSLSPPDFD